MKLTLEGIKDCELWNKAGITLPGYDVEKVSQKAKEEPKWVHFGIGNIFRIFIGGIADGLLEEGVLDRAITCVETFDYDVVDKIYDPYDNLGLSVILHGDGTREYKVLGSLAEAVKSVLMMAEEWRKAGFVDTDFIDYISDENVIAFPWTMIDKITPRPSEQIAADLEALGVEDMQPVITSKQTYIAPFVNAEKPQYLVIEDSFPNGRPALEKGFGVYLADTNTVNLSERMKVTVCLNPVHSATGPLGVVLGYDLFAHMLNTNEDMMKMARMVAYDEGLPVVADPGILSPQEFVDELFHDRFPNEYLGDTNLRLAVDVSQMVGIRFGETVKAYVAKYGDASKLTAIPLGIAGWLRYMLAVDDEGKKYELAPDPMNEELQEQLGDIVVGKPETFTDQLKPILSNERIFFTDLYKDGIGEKIEEMFREMIAGSGAVKTTIHKYVC